MSNFTIPVLSLYIAGTAALGWYMHWREERRKEGERIMELLRKEPE